ncbi:unnamed protein product [Bathycoccus prasinos]
MGDERDSLSLWGLIVKCDDICFTHILPRLNRADLKFLYEVNRETRKLIERSSRKGELKKGFKVREMSSISTLEFAWEHKSLWPSWLTNEMYFCYKVAQTNKLELLKWAREEKKCEWNSRTINRAAEQGNLEMVKYCVANKCPIGTGACAFAASNGHLEVLKYLHEEAKAPWDLGTAIWAAQNGHLHILEYLVERKYNKYYNLACERAARNGHLDCLKYLHETAKAPWNARAVREAHEKNHPECVQYLLDNNCPLPDGVNTKGKLIGYLFVKKPPEEEEEESEEDKMTTTLMTTTEENNKLTLFDAMCRLPLILLFAHVVGKRMNTSGVKFSNSSAFGGFKAFKMPLVTSYIFVGILSSTSFLNVLTPLVVRESLWLVDNACLSVIGVSAGAELSARDLRGDARKIIVWTISIALFTWMTVFTAFTVGKVSDRVEFLEDMNRNDSDDDGGEDDDSSFLRRRRKYLRACAIGSLIATLSIARSPASAIAVLRETEARGPFSKLVVSVTVLKDVLVVVLFALNMEMIESLGLMDVSVGGSTSSRGSDGSQNSSSRSESSTVVSSLMMVNETTDINRDQTSALLRHLMTTIGGEETTSTNDYEYQMRSIIRALEPVVSVFGSFVFGFFAGAPLHSVLRRLPSPSVAQTDGGDHQAAHVNVKTRFRALMRQSMKPLFTIVYSTTIFVVSKRLFLLEPLLVCVCCGIFCANRGNFSSAATTTRTAADEDAANKLAQQQLFNTIGSKSLHSSLVSLQPFVNLVFFTLAGVALEMEHVMRSAQAAILLVAFRILGIFIACRIASRLLLSSETSSFSGGGDNTIEQQRKVAWMAHVTQAGVALGLARTCSVKFSATWGEQFASVATAMIALNLLIGPPLFRIALTRVGEASSTEDNNRGVTVVIVDDKEDEERDDE